MTHYIHTDTIQYSKRLGDTAIAYCGLRIKLPSEEAEDGKATCEECIRKAKEYGESNPFG